MNKKILLIFLSLTGALHAFGQKWGKYTLYSLSNSTTTVLLDTNNQVFKTWTHAQSARTGYSVYLAPGGSALWRTVINPGNVLTGGGMHGRIQKVAWDGTVLWDWTYSSASYCLHHDICPLPNGNVLAIAYDVKSPAEVAAAGASQSIVVWSEKIMEIKPTGATTGQIVWEWKVWDHLMQNVNPAKSNYVNSLVNHPDRINLNYWLSKDWIHMNGLDYNPILDQVAFSSHYHNEWYIIDHSTTTAEAATGQGGNSGKGGGILYRYGNPAAYGAMGSAVLNVTHDVHWIPEGVPNAGRLVGFNNKGVSANRSSVDQIVAPRNGYLYDRTPGQAFQPTTYLERHACNGYSSNMSNSYQLPNGNMLVCMATLGTVYEVNPAGTTIWTRNMGGLLPHAYRYSECYVSTPPPAIPEISSQGAYLSASTADGYQWYLNGNKLDGATSQTILADQPGVYVVRVASNASCQELFSYSKGYKILGVSPLTVAIQALQSQICPGTSTKLSAQIFGGNGSGVQFSWTSDPAGFVSASDTISVSPTVPTTYTCIATQGNSSDTASTTITIFPVPPQPQIVVVSDWLVCTTTSSLYNWYLNGQFISSTTESGLTPTQDGAYTCTYLDQNGCISAFSPPFNFSVTSNKALIKPDEPYIFPNPASGRVSIRHLNTINPSPYRLLDAQGKVCQTGLFTGDASIDLSPLSSGIYLLKLDGADLQTSAFKIQLIK